MKRITTIAAALGVAVLAAGAAAQDTNVQEKTFITFSNTVELPGVTLPAGKYVFRLADSPSRNVVQVLTGDEKDVKGQWLFVQAERPEVSNETVIMFREAREGQTPAVQFWYYPGERTGKEFIYPKQQAQQIANRTGAEVLSDEGRISSNSSVSSTDSRGNVTPWPREGAAEPPAQSAAQVQADPVQPERPVGTSGREVAAAPEPAPQPAAPAPAPEPQVARTPQPESTQAAAELPRTASPLALTGLIGLLSLAGALGVRKAARH
jgi:hypothetical protein